MMTAEKKRPTKRAALAPVPTPQEEEPLIRIALNAEDMRRLLDRLGDWDDPIAHRFRMRFSKHRMRWSQ